MEITVNTNDLLGDESTIRDEVISQVVSSLAGSLRRDFSELIKKNADSIFEQVVTEKVEEITSMHLDTEFTEKTRYGGVVETTTVRNKIASILANQCEFQKKGYASDQNAFTNIVIKTVEQEMEKFRKEYISLVNKQLVGKCMDEAAKMLKEACGVK